LLQAERCPDAIQDQFSGPIGWDGLPALAETTGLRSVRRAVGQSGRGCAGPPAGRRL